MSGYDPDWREKTAAKVIKERDQLRELCGELLSLLKVYLDNGDVAQHFDFKNAITKAERVLGGE